MLSPSYATLPDPPIIVSSCSANPEVKERAPLFCCRHLLLSDSRPPQSLVRGRFFLGVFGIVPLLSYGESKSIFVEMLQTGGACYGLLPPGSAAH